MLPPNIERLVEQIIMKTGNGAIQWNQTYRNDQVSMSNQYFSVNIGYGYDPDRDISYYYVDYTDSNGHINRFMVDQGDAHFFLVKKAYDFAVASTLKIPDQW